MKLSRRSFVILPFTAALALAQTAVPVTTPPGTSDLATSAGETAITLDIGHGIRPVKPSRVTVPVGESLRITGPDSGGRPI